MRLPIALLLALLLLTACDSGDPTGPVAPLTVEANSTVTVAYEGRLEDGTVFDRSDRVTFALRHVIPGFRDGIIGMEIGETRTFSVPPEAGYGDAPPSGSGIPPNATLIFEVMLLNTFSPEVAEANSTVTVAYEGRLTDGTVFDRSDRSTFSLQRVIPGFRDGVVGMTVGETKTFSVAPEDGYGDDPPPGTGIPPNATLIFEVTLLDVE